MKRSEWYQITLISAGVLVTALLGTFLYREIFPEYKIYQNDYIALENFRSSYTDQPPPEFKVGIRQIVIEREDKGPALIDRCTSCHVALDIPYFSPTKIAKNDAGEVILDEKGWPVKVRNEEYIWDKLDQKIADLEKEGSSLAKKFESLKTARVGDQVYDVEKVLVMHPLIGKETRPFEFHPIEEYGCTSCHNGNGRGLVTDKAHGPVFDDQYEKEHMGPHPIFTESNPETDPQFAKVFNSKPAENLLFQTEPIFVGTLIQAKCMQCHTTSETEEREPGSQASLPTDIDILTKDYQRGRELFFSQACYACHRISGSSRGGVGPELTKIGDSYPWYIKESIVWPQADVKDSVMPNMRLDHNEIEDLMTFLLAQKGQTKAISKIDYQKEIQSWEGGKKTPWEKPITPAETFDLRYAMTLFATEGCAACHRLEGFKSNVGYSIETTQPAFAELYQEEEWFKSLFPEYINAGKYNRVLSGSEIVSRLERYSKEIDERIVDDVRSGSILEEIDQQSQNTVESFYSSFAFAARQHDDTEWKDRVRRVLMMYVQTYGLGRLIGPKPNWSGVYHSDEWLMEHFRNPGSHVPRSIMPIMPFDDSKFYALTNMLDHLGIRNRNAVQEIWKEDGFNSAKAYEMLCSQCHGLTLQGNGPVSEWIYPIPKNLRNSDFLRNLTKEQAINSITHGIKGTPMAPWGEVGEDKTSEINQELGNLPVLSQREIRAIVDWLFSSLFGGEVIKGVQDVPKWHYEAEDVLKELYREGSDLEPKSETLKNSQQLGQNGKIQAAFIPFLSSSAKKKIQEPLDVSDLFSKVPDPSLGPDHYNYYIKTKYYTDDNIDEGKKIFLVNCASCHGAEADGSGAKSQAMQEAKPRMLTNLDWSLTHDDLRLLRSIKYGVPGTAMTPWGDVTSSLQRLQLVIFIRSLNKEKELRRDLTSAIYAVFDTSMLTIDNARLKERKELAELSDRESALRVNQSHLEKALIKGDVPEERVLENYIKLLATSLKIESIDVKDRLLVDLIALLKKEKEIYQNLGVTLLTKIPTRSLMKQYTDLIEVNRGRYQFINEKLSMHWSPQKSDRIIELKEHMIQTIDLRIHELEKEQAEKDKSSSKAIEESASVKAEIDSYKALTEKLTSDIASALKLVDEQSKIIQQFLEVTANDET